jgi:uncharacterized protein (TIGR02996 family)
MGKRADMTTSMIADGMLREILLYPEAGPRLEYADWLDEHGDPAKAEFIRVQCELARLANHRPNGTAVAVGRFPQQEWKDEWDALRRRERELLQGRWKKWAAFPEALIACRHDERNELAPGHASIIWRRGFVEEIHCRLVDWYGETCQECECAHCDGTGIRGYCKTCRGTWNRQGQALCINCDKTMEDRICEFCRGSRHARKCPHCRDTGRIGGHGPAIVLAQPIMVARLTDEPDADSRLAIAWARREAGLVV